MGHAADPRCTPRGKDMKESTRKVYELLLDRKPWKTEDLQELAGVKNIRAAISEIRNRHGAVIQTVGDEKDSKTAYVLTKPGYEHEVPVKPQNYLDHFTAPKPVKFKPEFVEVPQNEEVHTILLTDLHIGSKGKNCDTPTTIRRLTEIFCKGMEEAARRSSKRVRLEIDVGGDAIHGEGIYPNQPWESDLPINKQLEEACTVIGVLARLARKYYPEVVVNFVPGNHGRTAHQNDQVFSNWDLTLGMLVREHLRKEAGVTVNVAQDFYMVRERLGHRFFLVHGHQGQSYPRFTSLVPRWKMNPEIGGFEVVEHGHYHNWSIHVVQGIPIVASGTLQTGGSYGLANFGHPEDRLMVMIGTTRANALAWVAPITCSD